MIDLPKTTKGRRMPKKTHKKLAKAPPVKGSARKSATSPKTAPSKTHPAAAAKTGQSVAKRVGSTLSKTSHKAPSKQQKKATESAATRSALIEGAKAPAFRLPRDGGGTVSLSDYAGRKLVLFFYPRADTPGCTKEAIDFTRLAGAFAESQTAVLGISADAPKAQEAFRDKHHLTTPLVSDEKHETLAAYGVWGEKSMYGRTFQGILRTTVLIDKDGRVARVWRNVKVDGHADEVLAAARAL
jgi:thioredoxin-dependent peroxiredoxin